MKVGVTGGSGFIGSHVVDALFAAGHEVTVLDVRPPHRSDVGFRHTDIFDSDSVEVGLEGLEAVYHLAAAADVGEIARDPLTSMELNLGGTARVLEAARKNQLRRVIFASTVWVYGAAEAKSGTVDERAAFQVGAGKHLYTSSKIAGEMLCQDYAAMYDLPFTILRYGIPYGPRMRPALVIPIFTRKALAGETLTVAGDGSQHRKFVYVGDLARAHVLALDPVAENQTYNLDGAEKVTIRTIAETVIRLTGSSSEVEFGPSRGGDYAGAEVSSELVERHLGWKPEVPFEEGMRRTVQWLVEEARSEMPAAR